MANQIYFAVGFKNKHTWVVTPLTNFYGDVVDFTEEEAIKQVSILNSVQMQNGEFIYYLQGSNVR